MVQCAAGNLAEERHLAAAQPGWRLDFTGDDSDMFDLLDRIGVVDDQAISVSRAADDLARYVLDKTWPTVQLIASDLLAADVLDAAALAVRLEAQFQATAVDLANLSKILTRAAALEVEPDELMAQPPEAS